MSKESFENKLLLDSNLYLDKVVPDSGFLRDYFDYASPLTEAPLIYHLFVGLSILAAVCGRRCFLPFGAQNIYPNIWTILLAPSSRYKKSTALNIGRRLLNMTELNVAFPNEFSREGLLNLLAKESQGIFFWAEMGGTLQAFEAKYMVGTKEMLTDMFDCPDEISRVLTKERITIKKPCITIASASTPNWLNKTLKSSDIIGGFLPRFILVTSDEPSKFLPIPPKPDAELELRLVNELLRISAREVEYRLTSDAKSFYEEWYKNQYKKINEEFDSELLAPFYSRFSVCFIKFSILYELASSNSAEISLASVEAASWLVRYLEVGLQALVHDEILIQPEARLRKRILRFIASNPLMSQSELLRLSHAKARDLNEAIASLESDGEIVVIEGPGRKRSFRLAVERR